MKVKVESSSVSALSSAVAHLVLVRPMRIALLMAVILALTRTSASSAEVEARSPVMELGTVVHFVPSQHADASMRGYGHGFVAFVVQQADENVIKPTFVAHSAAEFVAAYRRVPRALQQRGIWLTLQDGDPYSSPEKAMFEELKVLCAKHKFILFIRTGWDSLWDRFSGAPSQRSNHAMERTAGSFGS